MAESPLRTNAVLQRMADALPSHPPGDDSSDLASSYEAIALVIHAAFVALGFKLQGFDEDKPLPECENLAPRLPPQWNNGFGSLSFVYSHKQSAMRFIIRVDRLGGKVEVRGLAVGDDKIYRFERNVRDVVKSNGLPVRITISEGQEDRSDLVEKFRGVFVSEEALSALLYDLKVNLIQKLIPKLQSEGYVESETADAEAEATARSERRAQEAPDIRPDARNDVRPPVFQPIPEMARPRPQPVGDFPPPGFEDPYEMNRLGPNDPLRGSFVGGGLPRPGGGGGMHPTFDDPLFGGQGGASSGYDPQAPPGARWDPIGPGGGPRFGPNSGGGNNPFGGFGGGDII
ncbi:PI31 proteasome regulator N-terminal-domain-containing protein [Thelonectria olida]|uniref:PI31 proteasome regulator N-terminal-domain-containing protein n=1 Tax=Thelonectria olida TaxID=1576542 RepID=A0A9P9ATC0_9HYPO|nr:PI31 proteasome regulator N-terminal-domain-containing protein [Thelonectria olida]